MITWTRMMSRVALVVGSCLVAWGYSRCTFVSGTGGTVGSSSSGGYSSSSGGMNGGGHFTTTLILRDSTGVPATSFVMGEPIRFDLEIDNNDNQPATLQFPDAQTYDFYVLDTFGTTRWTWSDGLAFAQVSTQLDFTPYGSKSYSVLWNGVLANGTQLAVGTYRARGAIVAKGHPSAPLANSDLNSNIVTFTVR